MNYLEQLNDDRWLRKTGKIKARDLSKCINCDTEKKLEVHHLYYIVGKEAWKYPDKALITLCRKCHQKWHDMYEIEFRAKKWNKKAEYKPKFKTKKCNVKPRKIGRVNEPIDKLQKAKFNIQKRKAKGTMKPSFSPIPEWRQLQKQQVQ
jgi:hypothetical protein